MQQSYLLVISLLLFSPLALAQNNLQQLNGSAEKTTAPTVANQIEVKPSTRDEEIEKRLQGILEATNWFYNPEVDVKDGVVFLRGESESNDAKKWATELAVHTEGVTAVVNKLELAKPSIWDFHKAAGKVHEIWANIIRSIPAILFSLLILVVAGLATWLCVLFLKPLLRRKVRNLLITNVIAWGIGLFVFFLGLYLVFEVAGLTTVAFTVLGGTGLLGIVLGIAFKDITENFLASICLSLQEPFRKDDIVDIEGMLGFVQRLTARATVLLSFEGNHVQIPNATVYKAKILNYTSNPHLRQDFVVGISYRDSINKAQDILLKVVSSHSAVLKSPEPWVLADGLENSSVSLRVYFWIDVTQYSWLKVRSSVIRLCKQELDKQGITIPDSDRERLFPQGITVYTAAEESKAPTKIKEGKTSEKEEKMESEAEEIQKLASKSRIPEEGKDLL